MTTRLLIAAEVSHRLRISKRHVWRLARCGKLPSVRIGPLVRFPEDALDTFIANGGIGAKDLAQAHIARKEKGAE
jgi:excisionase family DNA binding protein